MFKQIKQQFEEGKTFLQFSFLKALGEGLTMAMPLVIAKFFSDKIFGSYSLARMLPFFFVMLFVYSLQPPFIVYANEERAKTGKINRTFSIMFTLMLTGNILFCILVLSFAGGISHFAKISADEVPYLIFAFVGLSTKYFLCNLFLGLGERLKNAVAELLFGIFSFFSIFLLYYTGMISIKSVFAVYLFCSVATIAVMVWTIDFSALFPFSPDIGQLSHILFFAKWQAFGLVAVYFINWGANLIFRYYNITLDDIGVFNFAFSFFKGIVTFIGVVGAYFLPFISANLENPEKIKDYLWHKRPKIFFFGLVCLSAIYFATPYFINYVYPGRYAGSVTLVRILLLASALPLYNVFYSPLFNAMKKFRYLQTINVFQVLLTVGLNFLLIPRYGFYGAAFTALIGYMFNTAALEYYFRKKIKPLLSPV
jgi:O-antigen/teichoic acid export membrane protein